MLYLVASPHFYQSFNTALTFCLDEMMHTRTTHLLSPRMRFENTLVLYQRNKQHEYCLMQKKRFFTNNRLKQRNYNTFSAILCPKSLQKFNKWQQKGDTALGVTGQNPNLLLLFSKKTHPMNATRLIMRLCVFSVLLMFLILMQWSFSYVLFNFVFVLMSVLRSFSHTVSFTVASIWYRYNVNM